MPTKNRVKIYIPEAYYHVYNRGVSKQLIFTDDTDYSVFLSLFKRYLSNDSPGDRYNRTYENLSTKVELLAYCLMPNHFHLLLYQRDAMGMVNLVRRILTVYSMYFNKKYRRIGQLFQDTYKARQIASDEYLQHISRYIHLNPNNWRKWKFSSLDYYLSNKQADWLKPDRIIELFNDRKEYMGFLSDYEDYKKTLDEIKHELADH